ncbi:unnamed protein product [Pseudo-nitzschia multistriata]|uniref:HIT-type domain-containing protein n=1 Tax=Pseudo-nitzschia multistriata TaxID=183589 RepID=A0A448Z8V9_9STRA|nr:unnamed protein product [Pseudo-nitzschia multistriata]
MTTVPAATQQSEEKNGNANDDVTSRDRRLCEECNEESALYQCPGCLIRTCSLKCCQAHKKRTKCSGKRPRGAYLPLCRMNDSTLRSDYFFMEEVLDSIPRARKISKLAEEGKSCMNRSMHGKSSNLQKSIASINKKAKRLVQQAQRRGITVQVMPPILERHKNNTSWYCGPRDLIMWKVEVVLVPTESTVSFNLSEKEESILDHIAKHITEFHKNDPNMPTKLSPQNYQLLIKRLPSAANSPRYARIENNKSLREVLEGFMVVEHPTIYCVPNEKMTDFPIGTKEIIERSCDTHSETVSDNYLPTSD